MDEQNSQLQEVPQSKSALILPKNKIGIINTFFITLDISLFILVIQYTSNYLNGSCVSMGCFANIPILLTESIVIGVFCYTTIKDAFNKSKGVYLKNLKDVQRLDVFRLYIKLTIILLVLIFIPLVLLPILISN